MILIEDLISLKTFMEQAATAVGDIDAFYGISNGEEGVQELQSLFERTIRPGQTICVMQVAEVPLTEGAFVKATFATTLMLLQKMDGTRGTFGHKLELKNTTFKQMLRLIGKVKLASEWFQSAYTEKQDDAYDVQLSIFQDRILPVGKIANANVQGWLVDIDVAIPVNALMYG